MNICKKCLYPDTKPGLTFEAGICSACMSAIDRTKIDWDEKIIELEQICNHYKRENHWDCIVPVSGGKDSHFITYYMKEKMKMKPLLVCFVPNDQTPLGRKNLDNLKKAFDVDCIEFYASPKEYHTLQSYGLHQLGDHAYPEHLGIFSVPFFIAKSFGVGLVVWGENPSFEYGGPPKKDGQFVEGLFKEELSTLQNLVYTTLKPDNVESIFLGDYVKWDAQEQVELMKQYGFTTAPGTMEWTYRNYENLDTKFVAIHDFFKWLKFGYGRAADQVGIDIRNGRMTREEGERLVEQYDGKVPTKYLYEFFKEMGITSDEFERLCKKFART